MATVHAIVYAAVIGLVFLKAVQIFTVAYDSKLRRVPGPFLSRFTTLPLKFHVLGGHRTAYIHSLHERYGKVVRIAPNEVDVADVDGFREIHRVGSGFVKSQWYQKNHPAGRSDADGTTGIFEASDPKRYAAIRKQYAPAFTPAAVKNWEPRVVAKVEQAVSKIKQEASKGNADVHKLWGLMTFDIITGLAFREDFDLVGKGEKTQDAIDIDMYMTIGGVNQELPFLWPTLTFLSLFIPKVRFLVASWDRLKAYGQIAIKNTREGLENGEDNQTIFAKMIAESDDPTKMASASLEVIADRAIGLTIGGSDTTGVTLTYLVWLVLRHPEVKAKLLAELKDLRDDTGYETLISLKQLNNVIDETLRLYPAAPGSLYRVVPAHGARIAGYELPGRTKIDTQAWTFHRSPESFTDPLTYDPDRWLDPTPAMKEAFMPFGGSSRQCIGLHLARMEMLHAVFRFFRACPDAVVVTNDEDMEPFDYFLMKPKGEKCLITTRKN